MEPAAQPPDGQHGQVVMAPVVSQAPEGCPPGLEHLAFLDQLFVKQKVEMLEGLSPLSISLRSLFNFA